MKKTFKCDSSMIITIPIGSLRNLREGHLMPEKFHCVYKDFYKTFVTKGKPKPLGAVQTAAGMFIFALGLVCKDGISLIYTLPSILFVICGILSYGAGRHPNMHVTKLSFALNILSFFWSLAALSLCAVYLHFFFPYRNFHNIHYTEFDLGIQGMIITLLGAESVITLFLIYWLSKALCRDHFNILPTILLKQGD